MESLLNVNGRLLNLSLPRVMGILNITPDSFYAAGRTLLESELIARAEQMLSHGADIIDVGACSTRPGAASVSAQEEESRLRFGLDILNRRYPGAILSVDTFRADIAEMCVRHYNVAIINDISGGAADPRMFETVARLGVPYILTHIQGTPQNMQKDPHYTNLLKEVFMYFAIRVQQLRNLGVKDIILDPGFGFGKTLDHNYELMARLDEFKLFELPLLVGISRKSMITRLLEVAPDQALTGSIVLHTVALMKGACLLRVHDVKEAMEAVKIVRKIKSV